MFSQEEEQKADTVSQFLMRRSLTKNQLIRLQTDIDHIFKAGKRCTLSCFKLLIAENNLPYSRMIVIPVRHYGNSVQRNKIRRQIKEIWRLHNEEIKQGLDYAFIVYPGDDLSYSKKEEFILDLLRKSNSLKS